MTEEEPVTPQPPVEASAEAVASAPDGRVAELETRVAELERQLTAERDAATDYMNRWQRAQADFANFKRRAQQDQQQLQRTFAAEAARLILPALDSFERAFATLPESLRSFTWISGTDLIRLQLETALNMAGIRLIEVEPGHPFDPAKHEAIGEVETADHPAGNVAVVVQRGYQVEGFVLRPALVQLAKAAASATVATAVPPISPQGAARGAASDDVGAERAESAAAGAGSEVPIPAESATAPPADDSEAQPSAPTAAAAEDSEPNPTHAEPVDSTGI